MYLCRASLLEKGRGAVWSLNRAWRARPPPTGPIATSGGAGRPRSHWSALATSSGRSWLGWVAGEDGEYQERRRRKEYDRDRDQISAPTEVYIGRTGTCPSLTYLSAHISIYSKFNPSHKESRFNPPLSSKLHLIQNLSFSTYGPTTNIHICRLCMDTPKMVCAGPTERGGYCI